MPPPTPAVLFATPAMSVAHAARQRQRFMRPKRGVIRMPHHNRGVRMLPESRSWRMLLLAGSGGMRPHGNRRWPMRHDSGRSPVVGSVAHAVARPCVAQVPVVRKARSGRRVPPQRLTCRSSPTRRNRADFGMLVACQARRTWAIICATRRRAAERLPVGRRDTCASNTAAHSMLDWNSYATIDALVYGEVAKLHASLSGHMHIATTT
jgi:hypothetical protein